MERLQTVLLSGFYSFFEEFIFRDVLPELLQKEKTLVRYLIPNILFGAAHICNYAGWGTITPSLVLKYTTSQMWAFAAIGCLMQLIKEKSGTIWLPILIHAVWDFSDVLIK